MIKRLLLDEISKKTHLFILLDVVHIQIPIKGAGFFLKFVNDKNFNVIVMIFFR